MLPAVRFSRHALDRVQERLTATKIEIAALLNSGLSVPIGAEPHSRRMHRLFHSQRDRSSFVAVQDERDGTVVTVLPIDYHELCAWHISTEARRAARSLADYCDPAFDQLLFALTGVDPTLPVREDAAPPSQEIAASPAVARVAPPPDPAPLLHAPNVRVSGWRDGHKVVKLGRWPLGEAGCSPQSLLSDRALLLGLEAQMLRYGADVDLGVAVRLEPSGASAILRGLAAAFAWARGENSRGWSG